jgi:hypothetical protein
VKRSTSKATIELSGRWFRREENIQCALRERTLACEVVVEVVKATNLGPDEKLKVNSSGNSIHKAMLEVSGFVGNRC